MWTPSKYGGLNTPKNRQEFEHNVALVYEDVLLKSESSDKQQILSIGRPTLDHLIKLKALPNRRYDLLSVDEQLRLQGNTMNFLQSGLAKKIKH